VGVEGVTTMKLHHHNHQTGFSLVELIVVIAIVALTSTVAFFNFRNLQNQTTLSNAANDLVSLLRLAQANAKTQVNCQAGPSRGWGVYVDSNTKDFKLFCWTTAVPTFTSAASAVQILSFNGSSVVVNSILPGCATLPIQIEFEPLYGDARFRTGPLSTDYTTCNNALGIRLLNTNGGDIKDVIINTAGAIELQ